MGMYTWLSDSEFELYSKLSNKELNEVFQEVRELMPDVFISERTEVTKRWFSENEIKTFYSVYHLSGRPEVRCINLNFSTASHVYNYLCGLVNGYHANKK